MLTMIWACAVPAKADLDEILKDSSGELWQMAMFKRAELETIADDPNNSSKEAASDILWLSSCGAWPFLQRNLLEALLSSPRSNGYLLQKNVQRPDNENDQRRLAQMLLKGNAAQWRKQAQSSTAETFWVLSDKVIENFTFWDVILDPKAVDMDEFIRTNKLGWFVLQHRAGGYEKNKDDRWDIASQELKMDRWGLRNGPPPLMPFPEGFVIYLILQDRLDDASLVLQARRHMQYHGESSTIWLARIVLLQGALPIEIEKWEQAWASSKSHALDALTLAWLHRYAGHAPESKQWLERSAIKETRLQEMLNREQMALQRAAPPPPPDLDKIFTQKVESGLPEMREFRLAAITAMRAKWDGNPDWHAKFRSLMEIKMPNDKCRQFQLATLYSFGCWDEILPFLQSLGQDDFIFDFGINTPKWREAVDVAEEQIKKKGVVVYKDLTFRLLSEYLYTLGNDARAKELFIEFLKAHPKQVFHGWYAPQIYNVRKRLGLMEQARAAALSVVDNANAEALKTILPLFLPPEFNQDYVRKISVPLLLQAVRQARPDLSGAACNKYLLKLAGGTLPKEESRDCLKNFGLSLQASDENHDDGEPRGEYLRTLFVMGWVDLGMELFHNYMLQDAVAGRSSQLLSLDFFMDCGLWTQAAELLGYYVSRDSFNLTNDMHRYLFHWNRMEEGRRYLRLAPLYRGHLPDVNWWQMLPSFKQHLPELLSRVEIMKHEDFLPISGSKMDDMVRYEEFDDLPAGIIYGQIRSTDENLMRWMQFGCFAEGALVDQYMYSWPAEHAEHGAATDLGWAMHHAARYLELSPDARKRPEGRAHYDDALRHFRAGGETTPMFSVLLWKRWHAFLVQAGNDAEAKTVYEQARRMPDDILAAYPRSPAARLFLGQLEFATGHDPKNTLAIAASLLDDEPDNFAAMLLLLRATKQIHPPSFPDLLKKAQSRHPDATWEEYMEERD